MKDGLNIDQYGNKYWYQNNQRHRTNGPAIEWANGSKYWYLFDIEYNETTYWALVNNPSLFNLL